MNYMSDLSTSLVEVAAVAHLAMSCLVRRKALTLLLVICSEKWEALVAKVVDLESQFQLVSPQITMEGANSMVIAFYSSLTALGTLYLLPNKLIAE